MQPEGDERAVSELAGAVLVLAAIVITMGIYQATVVPAQNQEIEFNHNLRIQDDLLNLRQAVHDTGETGVDRTVMIELGVRYPGGRLFINPAPPAGTLLTEGTAEPSTDVIIENATASGEVSDFWDGSTRRYATASVVYRPAYNEYSNAPMTRYENSVVYNQFDDVVFTLSPQFIVNGRDVTLVTLAGNLSESGVRATSVDVRAVTTSKQAVSVADTGGNVSISFPTQLPASTWRTLLDGEFVANGTAGHVVAVTVTPIAGSTFDRATLELEAGVTYDLRLAKVGIGSGVSDESGRYLTLVDRPDRTIENDTSHFIVLETRDRFNGPVSGFQVNATVSGGGSLTDMTVETDVDGQATFEYTAPAGESEVTLTFSIYDGTPDYEVVTVDVTVTV